MATTIILIFLNVFLLVALLLYILYFVEGILNSRPNRVVYVSSNIKEQGEHVAALIRKYAPDTEKYVLVEPGAGLGRMARYLGRRFAWNGVIAVELRYLLTWGGRFAAWRTKAPVRFVQRDIFAWPFPSPAVVYSYLTSDMLGKLHTQGKLDGSLVISLTFPIPGLAAEEEIPLPGWQARLLVYDFRKKS